MVGGLVTLGSAIVVVLVDTLKIRMKLKKCKLKQTSYL